MLRPLRLARNPALRDTIGSLMSSLSKLFYACVVNILFLYIFAILGVQIMCGKTSHCENKYYINKIECLEAGEKWVTPLSNYNNIFAAMRTFFEM